MHEIAVAPPGGCTVSVTTMATIASITPRPTAYQVHPSTWETTSETSAEMTCPKKTFLGRAARESGMENRITAVAPNEGTRRGCPRERARYDTIESATKPPVANIATLGNSTSLANTEPLIRAIAEHPSVPMVIGHSSDFGINTTSLVLQHR